MEKIITLASKDQCTGCGACLEICPKGAIIFAPDEEGFPTPAIDKDSCVRCGLCEKTCPALHLPEMHSIQKAYAAQIKEKDILKDSTSGGLFTVFAREILNRGGVVYGCVWEDDYNAVVCKAKDEDGIKPMRGSKYVWSWAGDTFPEVKDYLEKGKAVLFTGLPCQVAGLKSFLKKDYDNLFLIDFFCGGAPSPFAFREYLKSITKEISLQDLDLKFRDKDKYGVGVHITYNAPKGRMHQTYVSNPYYFSFYTKIFNRKSCYHCQYRYAQRIEDITIGDYWGVGQYHTEFNVREGVSALLINTEKGKELFNAVKDQLHYCDTVVQNIAKGNNLTLENIPKVFSVPVYREAFFAELHKNGWTAAERKYLYNKSRLKSWIRTKIPSKWISLLKRY